MTRTLALKAERLTELSATELTSVAGGDATAVECVSRMFALCDDPSRVASLCYCVTNVCAP